MIEALGSVVIGAGTLFGYNRKNYMYDRKMRQEQEFTIAEMRLKQAELWREDVRDISELTERKMDTYLIVNALQLGFVITLFVEGRLEQGTPQWLLWLYLLSLSGAFMFLLLSVWLSMHASVVAQSSSARLLTQLVRLPVPSWEQLESMRTYAASFEAVPTKQMFRIPMVQTISEGASAGAGGYSGPHDAEPGSAATDPWGLERRGDDIYELSRGPLTSNRHLKLLREASKHWRAYDAFSRASLSLGTIMMCQSVGYFVLGYVLINEGAPWAAWTVMGIMLTIACTILRMDMSMARSECYRVQAMLVSGPAIACIAGAEWATWRSSTQHQSLFLLPLCFICHMLFLLTFLRLCRVFEDPSGAMLPLSFQSVLYLDIFGWLARNGKPKPPPECVTFLSPGSVQFAVGEKEHKGYQALKLVSLSDSCKDIATFVDESFELKMVDAQVVADEVGGSSDQSGAVAVASEFFAKMSDRSGVGSLCSTSVPQTDEEMQMTDRPSAASGTERSSDGGLPTDIDGFRKSARGPPWLNDGFANITEFQMPAVGLAAPAGPPMALGPGGRRNRVGFNEDAATSHVQTTSCVKSSKDNDKLARRRRRSYLAVHAQNFPRRSAFNSKAEALRPEDVEIAACQGEEDSSDADEHSPKNNQELRLEGVGPIGVVPQASGATFQASTFAPDPSPEFAEDAVTGRDLHDPGKLPWHLFRGGVRFLSGLWMVGVLWSTAQVFGVQDIPDKVLPSSVSVSGQIRSPLSSESLFFGAEKEERFLPKGRRVYAAWPSARFQPRGLSADPSGRYLAVSDEFDIYFARVVEEKTGANVSYRLAYIEPAPHCAALEGQAIRDVAVLCASGGLVAEAPSCEALVLYAEGRRVATCRLSPPAVSHEAASVDEPADAVWAVSGKWLRDLGNGRKKEEVISVVVDMNCEDSASLGRRDSCVVVGTSHGRMVQLRRHMHQSGELVPASALWNVLGKAALEEQVDGTATSLLTAIPGGYVLRLGEGQHNVYAIDVEHKRVIGKWRVPQLPGRTWTAIAGGATALYLASQGGPCSDSPVGWIDSKGYSCKEYAERKWCTSTGEYGHGWFVLWGDFMRFANFGQTASTACCQCGGGDNEDRAATSEIWRFPLPEELQRGVDNRWVERWT